MAAAQGGMEAVASPYIGVKPMMRPDPAAPVLQRRCSMPAFDYAHEAELFPSRNRKSSRTQVRYRRFGKAAEAIRFAIEELPPALLVGAYLEVAEERFDGHAIRRLYESADYPLPRRVAACADAG